MNNYGSESSLVPWKKYLTLASECLLAFTLATFCLAIFFTHEGSHFILQSILIVLLYLFILFVCIKKFFQGLSFATLMLFIPIAPLIPIAVILILIPILEKLK